MIGGSAAEGAGMRPKTLVFACSLLLLTASAAHAKSYSADRFDARIQVLRGGAIEVTETIVFRFDGTFSEVFRMMPRKRLDGVEVLRVSMDGVPFTLGKGAGQYDLTRKDGRRVSWHFAPITNSTHTFELTYVVQGVVQQSDAGDLLEWQALPSEHRYPIASSTVGFDLPAPPVSAPALESKRTATGRIGHEDTHVTASAANIRSNGWISVSIVMPRGSVIDTPPAWQARQLHAATLVPMWLTVAGTIVLIGLVVLFALRQGSDAPDRETATGPTGPDLPDTLAPALAGTLVANGRSGLEQAMATLFSLAERGELTIVERPKRWGQRAFILKRTHKSARLAEHEQAVLDAAFTGRGPEDQTELAQARGRVTRRLRKFERAVQRQLLTDGLMDEGRLAVRARYGRMAFATLLLGLTGMLAAAVFVNRFGPWLLLVPGAIMFVAVAALIAYASLTPLSNEGIRRARAWRGFQKFLRQVTRDRASVPDGAAARLLPFAVATGLATGWASYLKKHRQDVPPWFRAVANDDGGMAFVYFVGSGGSGAGSGGSGGSGAAGGGASGAH